MARMPEEELAPEPVVFDPQMQEALQRAVQHLAREMRNDPLKVMFLMQRKLQERVLGEEWKPWDGQFPLSEDQKQYLTHWTDKWLTCIEMEAAETRDWTPWKHWSQRLGNKNDEVLPWSAEHIKEIQIEIIDMIHFWMNLAMIFGMDDEKVFAMYCEKNQINHGRQNSGQY